jgi:FtsP/CotA-like multicopper oxidase with cupredoxin domain
MNRRQFIAATAAAGSTLLVPAARAPAALGPDVSIRLSAASAEVPIRAGAQTRVLRYFAQVQSGRADAVRPSGSYLGPTLDLRRGERVRIDFYNELREPSIVHWHGLIVPERADGHPRHAIPPGASYRYEFTVSNPAGTYLYHPHPHGRTGHQVYHGLAGMLVIRERSEAATGLPGPAHELPLVLQDRRFDANNQFVYSTSMMDRMLGVMGDDVLVNGRSDAAFKVAPTTYRLRILNASNARIYKLAWSDDHPLTVIGTDNGLLDAAAGAQSRPYVMLGPTERVEVLEDFGARPAGSEIALQSESFDSGARMQMMGGGMMGGMMGGGMMGGGMMGGGTQGEQMHIARFGVMRKARQPAPRVILPPASTESREPRHTLTTRLAFRHMRGFLNGREFEMETVANDERVPRNEQLLWTFEHDESRGMNMLMPHPMHLHGVRFRIVERQRGAGAPADVADGLIDQGYKDSMLVFPGERVKLLLAATEPGLFMYHCHNLEHEDAGMMRNFLVEGS